MECMQANHDGSVDDASGVGGAAVLDLFVGTDFECDCTVWAYVLWGLFEEAEYDVLYLQRTDSREGETVFCLSAEGATCLE